MTSNSDCCSPVPKCSWCEFSHGSNIVCKTLCHLFLNQQAPNKFADVCSKHHLQMRKLGLMIASITQPTPPHSALSRGKKAETINTQFPQLLSAKKRKGGALGFLLGSTLLQYQGHSSLSPQELVFLRQSLVLFIF